MALFSLDKKLGSVIPMLFTPVAESALYEEYRGYLFDETGFDLQHLNGNPLTGSGQGCSRSWNSTDERPI